MAVPGEVVSVQYKQLISPAVQTSALLSFPILEQAVCSSSMKQVINSLWPHQKTTLEQALQYEMKFAKEKSKAQAIIATPPGSGKTRIALALALIPCGQDVPAVQTVIVVQKTLLAQWKTECELIGLKPASVVLQNTKGESFSFHVPESRSIILVVEYKLKYEAQTRLGPIKRIIYDETESLKAVPGKKYVCPPHCISWLLHGTLQSQDFISARKFYRFDPENEDPYKPIATTVYMPNVGVSSVQGKTSIASSWGIHSFPFNTLLCCPNFVQESQNLNLPSPILIEYRCKDMKKQLSACGFSSHALDMIDVGNYSELSSNYPIGSMTEYAQMMLQSYRDSLKSLNMNLAESAEVTSPQFDLKKVQQWMNKKKELTSQMAILENKIKAAHLCAICWEEPPVQMSVLQCCHTKFCYNCIKQALKLYETCPYCRTQADKSKLTIISDARDQSQTEAQPGLPFRRNVFTDILINLYESQTESQKPPQLIAFCASRQVYMLTSVLKEIVKNVKSRYGEINVQGTATFFAPKNTNASILQDFKEGKIHVFVMDGQLEGKGHNLCMADHILILTDKTFTESSYAQCIARVQRPGRASDAPLKIHMVQ